MKSSGNSNELKPNQLASNRLDLRLGRFIFCFDINISKFEFAVDGEKILFGLGAIKEVGSKAIETIINEREEKNFESLRDFCYRVDLFTVNKKVIENLIKVGAFDSLPGERTQKLSVLDGFIREGQEYQKNKKSGQRFLFEAKGEQQSREDDFDESKKDVIKAWKPSAVAEIDIYYISHSVLEI